MPSRRPAVERLPAFVGCVTLIAGASLAAAGVLAALTAMDGSAGLALRRAGS